MTNYSREENCWQEPIAVLCSRMFDSDAGLAKSSRTPAASHRSAAAWNIHKQGKVKCSLRKRSPERHDSLLLVGIFCMAESWLGCCWDVSRHDVDGPRHARLSALLIWDGRPFWAFSTFKSTIKLAIKSYSKLSTLHTLDFQIQNDKYHSQWPTQSPSLSPTRRTLRRRKPTENGPASTTTKNTRPGCHGWKTNISSGSAKTTRLRTLPKVREFPLPPFLKSRPSKC